MCEQRLSNSMPFEEGVARVRNPCRGICSTSTVGSIWCVGCGRYYKDVINWNSYDEEQKIRAMWRSSEHQRLKSQGQVNDHTDYLDERTKEDMLRP
jgi:predicted Fe-S protein YdhL (DUF1289 family)